MAQASPTVTHLLLQPCPNTLHPTSTHPPTCVHRHTHVRVCVCVRANHGEVAQYKNDYSDPKELLQMELSWGQQEPQDLVVNLSVGCVAGPGGEGRGGEGRGGGEGGVDVRTN